MKKAAGLFPENIAGFPSRRERSLSTASAVAVSQTGKCIWTTTTLQENFVDGFATNAIKDWGNSMTIQKECFWLLRTYKGAGSDRPSLTGGCARLGRVQASLVPRYRERA